jgi:transposase
MSSVASSIQWIGLDVSSTDCYAAKPGAKPKRFRLSLAGVAALLAWATDPQTGGEMRFAMEHTGVYSRAWATLLQGAGALCCLCNPARIRHFACGSGQRSKTDRADAVSILAYAQYAQPPLWTAPPAAEDLLAHYLTVRNAIISDRQGWVNRSKAHSFLPSDLTALQPLLAALEATLRQAEAQIDSLIQQLIAADPRLARANKLFLSIPGVGWVTAAVLCRWLTALAAFSPAQLSALSGLAPSHRQSGHSVRGRSRIDKAGPASLRCALYMAALAARRFCPGLIELYEKLLAAGRPKKLALCAVARQLLELAQAVYKSGEPLRRKRASAA